MGAALKKAGQAIKASDDNIGIGIVTMLGFEDVIKVLKVCLARSSGPANGLVIQSACACAGQHPLTAIPGPVVLLAW